MTYRIDFTGRARRDLASLDRPARVRVATAIELLGTTPRPPKATPLKGRPGWRIRVGDYRVIYEIEDDVLLIEIVRIGHRGKVYR